MKRACSACKRGRGTERFVCHRRRGDRVFWLCQECMCEALRALASETPAQRLQELLRTSL